MPLTLNIGLSRKVGEANYGSRGASVNLEIELDSQLVTDPAKLQERIRQCFGMVRVSLDEELTGGNGNAEPDHHGSDNRPRNANGNSNGHGASRFNNARGNNSRPATSSQIKAIHAIARRHRIDLAAFLQERFHIARPDDLTLQEASTTIDDLKASDTSKRS
jgi:hypothetical protein